MFGGVGYDACHRTANYAQGGLSAETIERNGCISPDSSRIFRRLKEVREIFCELGAQALRRRTIVSSADGFRWCIKIIRELGAQALRPRSHTPLCPAAGGEI